MNAPCKDCPKRVLGCHSTCAEYKEFSDTSQQINKQRRDEAMVFDNPYRLKKWISNMIKRRK